MQNIKEYVANKKLALKEKLKGNNLKAVIVQVGNVEASNRYVRNKIKDLEEVGITTELIKLADITTEEQLLTIIESLNAGVCDKRYHYRNKIKELPLIVLIDTSNFSALSE